MTRRLLAICFSLTTVASFCVSSFAGTPNVVVTTAYTFVPGDVDEPNIPLHIRAGDSLVLWNLDVLGAHDLTSYALDANGDPLFDSGETNAPLFSPVRGVEALAPGEYPFYCGVHGSVMEGVLIVDRPLI